MTTTVRVRTETRDKVTAVAARLNVSADEVIERALQSYEREMFWRRCNEVHRGTEADDDADLAAWSSAAAEDLLRADADGHELLG